MLEPVSIEQVFVELLKMKVGEQRTFLFDHDVQRGELSALCVRVITTRKDRTAVSFRRDGRTVYADCYIPPTD